MVLTAYRVLSGETRLGCHQSPAGHRPADLAPVTKLGRQDHTPLPSPILSCTPCDSSPVHRIPFRVRGDHELPLLGMECVHHRLDLGSASGDFLKTETTAVRIRFFRVRRSSAWSRVPGVPESSASWPGLVKPGHDDTGTLVPVASRARSKVDYVAGTVSLNSSTLPRVLSVSANTS
jgi:hypothetical protein